MNDILLTPSGQGQFDWTFESNDLVNIVGNKRLYSAVIHALSLVYGELEQVLYKNKGNKINYFSKLAATETHKDLIKEEIIRACNEINGINDTKVELDKNSSEIIVKQLIIIKENGEEVQII